MRTASIAPARPGEGPPRTGQRGPDTRVAAKGSPADEIAAGRALRSKVPCESHGEWKPPGSERDPLAILRTGDAVRLPELIPIRYGRMLRSPFTFYRGSAAIMAADLAKTPRTDYVVQASGDCHLGNFGGFASPERNIIFDITDFDETLPAPWEWDLKRLAASLAIAGRTNGLSDEVARDAAVTAARSYRKAIRSYAKMNPLDLWYTQFESREILEQLPDDDTRMRLERRIERVTSRHGSEIVFPRLTQVVAGEIQIRENPPLIFHPEEKRSADFRPMVEDAIKQYRDTLLDDRRVLFDRFHFVDAAMKVVGVGSVGTRCWVALLMSAENVPLFLQLKQANASVLEPFAAKSAYPNHGQRVVIGQRLMQAASDIFLGWISGPSGDFYVRQLRNAKVSPPVDTFDALMLSTYATLCGRNLARAHAKTGNARAMRGYLGKGRRFDEAIGTFAMAYADQAEHDHAVLKAAVKARKINAATDA